MKKLLLPLLLLVLAGPAALAQNFTPHPEPDKNDDTIVLTLPDEGHVAWQRAAGVLATRGYTFRYSDADLLALSTDPITIEGARTMFIFVQVQGHQLLLRGRWLGSNDQLGDAYATSRGGVLGGTSNDWTELEAIARQLGGTATYYNSAAR